MAPSSGKTPAPPKVFAIGDIHGCVRELQLLLAHLPLEQDSVLIFLGDYIDRGNHSRQVIETILSLKKQYKVITLKGNHEAMLLDFLADPESHKGGMFILNGGSSTLASYSDQAGTYTIPGEHVDFFKGLRLFDEMKDFFFVHAGVPEIALSEIDPVEDEMFMLWVRTPFLKSTHDWGKVIVHGHSPVDEPQSLPNRINVDTSCVFGGKLTAVELPARRFYSVARSAVDEPRVFLKDKDSKRVSFRFDGAIAVFVSRGGHSLRFETLNYSEFGMLIREARTEGNASLALGEKIMGEIGNDSHSRVDFSGEVVRCETRQDGVLYGIRMDKVESIDERKPR